MYDAFVRGVNLDEIAEQLKVPLAAVVAEIDAQRAAMLARYPGITEREADELRVIYLLGRDARKVPDNPQSVKIDADLQTRRRDILTTAAARADARKWREEQL